MFSTLIQVPPARLHSDYSIVKTLQGSAWKRNLASEGFQISLGKLIVTLDTASELVFPSPLIPTHVTSPSYGRKLSLTTNYMPAGTLTKSTYISTKDSSGATDVWVLLQLRYTPGSPALVELLLNGISMLTAPITPVELGGLVLADYSFTVMPIHDKSGEITLQKPWPSTTTQSPTFAIIQHAEIPNYPTNFIGHSPTVGLIELARGMTSLPEYPFTTSPSICALVGSPLLTLKNENKTIINYSETKINLPLCLYGSAQTPDTGSCHFLWETSAGTIEVGAAPINRGQIEAMISFPTPGFGWLRVENRNQTMSFSYLLTNPLPCLAY